MEFPLTGEVIVLGDIVHTWQCLCAGVHLAIAKYAQSLLQSLLLGAQVSALGIKFQARKSMLGLLWLWQRTCLPSPQCVHTCVCI